MDLSKLPKLSGTDKPAPAAVQSPQSPVKPIPSYASPRGTMAGAGTGGEVWVSAILSLVFLYLGRNFASYVFSRLTGRPYATGAVWTSGAFSGQPVAYPDLVGHVMLNDASMFLFGLTLLFEAFVLALLHTRFSYKRPLLILSVAVAVIGVLFNAYASVRLFASDVVPILSLLAVAFGGYIALHQWKLLVSTREQDPQILS